MGDQGKGSIQSKNIGGSYQAEGGYFCLHCSAWQGDLGLEPTPELYLAHMMQVMAEVERVLRDDGVCFVNIGDSYNAGRKGGHPGGKKQWKPDKQIKYFEQSGVDAPGIKAKSLCLIPQKFAIKCQEQGWIIRSEIIWAKPNPMPESVKDRPTRSHEQVWMMTKQGQYYWDQDAVREPHNMRWYDTHYKYMTDNMDHYKNGKRSSPGIHGAFAEGGRNIRDVWSIATEPTPEAHFATWPSKLVERMIRAATKPGDIVLDPFCGTAKSVTEAGRLNRTGIGLDLSWEYLADIAQPRLDRPIQRELAAL